MKELFKELTKSTKGEIYQITCAHSAEYTQLNLWMPIEDIIMNSMVEKCSLYYIKNILDESIDLTRISAIHPKSRDSRIIAELAKTFKTEIAFVGGRVYTEFLDEMRRTVSLDYNESYVRDASYTTFKSSGTTMKLFSLGLLPWDYDYIHFTNHIELASDLSKYLHFTQTKDKYKLSVDPIKLPTSYKIKICS